MLWRTVIRVTKAYPIRNGIANIMWCLYPKNRRKVLFGRARGYPGKIFHALAWQKECEIVEGHLMAGHVQYVYCDSPKVCGCFSGWFLKGKSAIAVAKQLCGKERNFTGEHFWVQGMRYPPLDSS
jgi:putative transposase